MKRVATTKLTKENWNKDDDDEESMYCDKVPTANEAELKRRIIKIAKKRLNNAANSSTDSTKSTFSGFSVFGVTNKGKEAFNFLSKKANLSTLVSIDSKSEETDKIDSVITQSRFKESGPKDLDDFKKSETTLNNDSESTEELYISNLEWLNTCFREWIIKCLNDDASCILTPVFKDYENHLNIIIENRKAEMRRRNNKFDIKCDTLNHELHAKPIQNNTNISKSVTFQFGNVNTDTSDIFKCDVNNETSGMNANKGNIVTINNCSELPAFKSSSFSPKSQSEGTANTNDSSQQTNGHVDETDGVHDINVGFDVSNEDGLIYSKRCKLFFKGKESYESQGISIMLLKLIDRGKCQLIVRSDDKLGRVKVNCLLNKSIPLNKSGENNVMFVCSPMPDVPPVPILIKVKTSDDANEVIDMLNKYKK